jgi:hypothetical protein
MMNGINLMCLHKEWNESTILKTVTSFIPSFVLLTGNSEKKSRNMDAGIRLYVFITENSGRTAFTSFDWLDRVICRFSLRSRFDGAEPREVAQGDSPGQSVSFDSPATNPCPIGPFTTFQTPNHNKVGLAHRTMATMHSLVFFW